MEAVSEQIRSRITNANFPKDEEGRVFHLAANLIWKQKGKGNAEIP